MNEDEEFKKATALIVELENFLEDNNLTLHVKTKTLVFLLSEHIFKYDDVEHVKQRVFKDITTCLRFLKQKMLH